MDDPLLWRAPELPRPGPFRALARFRNQDRLMASDFPVIEIMDPVEDPEGEDVVIDSEPSPSPEDGKRRARYGIDHRPLKKLRLWEEERGDVRHRLLDVIVPGRAPIPQRDEIVRSFGQTKGFYNVNLVCKDGVTVPYVGLWLMEESPVFLAKMQHGKSFKGEMGEICFPDLEGAAVASVLQALNAATITLSMQNVESVLLAADVLGVTSVKEACGFFLLQMLPALLEQPNPQALLEVLNLADRYSLASTSICREAACEAARHYPDSVEGVLGDLSEDFMACFLASDNLLVETEMDVFRCIQRWHEQSESATDESVVRLFQEVRIKRLHPCQLEELMESPILAQWASAMQRINGAMMRVIKGMPFPKRLPESRDRLYTIYTVHLPQHGMDRHMLMERHILRFGDGLAGSMYVERRLIRGELMLKLMVPVGSPHFILGMWTEQCDFHVIGDTSVSNPTAIQTHGGNQFRKYDWCAVPKPWSPACLHLEFRKPPAARAGTIT